MVGLTMSKAGATEKLGCTAPAARAATLAEVVELPLPLLLPEAEPPPLSPAAEVVAPVDDAEEPGVVMVLLLPPDEAADTVLLGQGVMGGAVDRQGLLMRMFALDVCNQHACRAEHSHDDCTDSNNSRTVTCALC